MVSNANVRRVESTVLSTPRVESAWFQILESAVLSSHWFRFDCNLRQYDEGEIAGQAKSTVKLNGANLQPDVNHTFPLNAGTWPVPGVTDFSFVVTALDGKTKSYTLRVVRAVRRRCRLTPPSG